jgi:ABC-type bacteriocin/lantibiotic exporter with double-glycine peptidase domain
VLLLDEATSALDSESEALVQVRYIHIHTYIYACMYVCISALDSEIMLEDERGGGG